MLGAPRGVAEERAADGALGGRSHRTGFSPGQRPLLGHAGDSPEEIAYRAIKSRTTMRMQCIRGACPESGAIVFEDDASDEQTFEISNLPPVVDSAVAQARLRTLHGSANVRGCDAETAGRVGRAEAG